MKARFVLACAISAALLCFAAIGSADEVQVDYSHHANFQAYHTYSWGKIWVSDQFDEARIRGDVDQILQGDGWKEVASGGQITIMATDRIRSKQEMESYYVGMGGWRGGGVGDETTTQINLKIAHVVIDMFDTNTKVLLWRGASRAELSGKPEVNRIRLREDIERMFEKFPPEVRQ